MTAILQMVSDASGIPADELRMVTTRGKGYILFSATVAEILTGALQFCGLLCLSKFS